MVTAVESARAETERGRVRYTADLFPVVCYLVIGFVLGFVVWFSANHMAPTVTAAPQAPYAFPGDFLLQGWIHLDAGWYLHIADTGYWYTPTEPSVAFFPAYPLLVGTVGRLISDPSFALAGILTAALCGLTASVLLYRWARDHLSRPAARLTVLLALLYPYVWYLFGAVYADALFLMSALAAFVLLERDHPVAAGLCGAVAAACRPVGVGVILGLVAVTLERREIVTFPGLVRAQADGWRAAWREWQARLLVPRLSVAGRWRPRDLGVLLSIAGLAGWLGYLWVAFGDPLLFIKVEGTPGWDQPPGWRTWFKVPFFGNLTKFGTYVANGSDPAAWTSLTHTLGITLQAVLVLGALAAIPLIIRRLGWGYALYIGGVVGIPALSTKDWQGTGRYLLAAFPVFAAAAAWMHESWAPRWRAVALGLSATLLVFLTSAFARNYYVA